MNTQQDIQSQIYEAQRRRSDAVQAENARLQAENAAAREIQAADAELAALHKQQKQAEFEESKARNHTLLAAASAEQKRFLDWLESPTVTLAEFLNARDPLAGYRTAYEAQQQNVGHIINLAEDAAWEQVRADETLTRSFSDNADRLQSRRSQAARQLTKSMAGGLPLALPPNEMLAVWVSESATPEVRARRVKLASWVFGSPIDPSPGYQSQAGQSQVRFR